MTSNVVAMPGIGIGPNTPVRASDHAGKSVGQDAHGGGRDYSAKKTAPQQPANNNNAGPTRPTSPVALNSLLAAQEQGAEGAPKPADGQAPHEAPHQAPQLSEAEQKQVEELKKNDAAVRRHEQAHAAAGGQYAGAPQYGYTDGPDGKRYASSGHVSIDVSPVAGDPKATIEKMDVVQRAANAPAEPSGADRSVAANAAATKQTAQVELAQLKAEEFTETKGNTEPEDAGKTTQPPSVSSDTKTAENSPAHEAPTSIAIPKSDDDKESGLGLALAQGEDKQSSPAAAVSHAAAAAAYAAPLNAIAGT
jgi:hypothetical protein